MSNKKIKFKSIIRYLLLILLAVIIIVSFRKVLEIIGYAFWLLTPFIISYLLSLIVNPMVDKIEKRFHLPRSVCAVLVIVLTVGVIGGIVTGIIWKIIDEVRELYMDFPSIAENLRVTWLRISDFFADFRAMMPKRLQIVFNDMSNQILNWITGIFADTEIVRSAGTVAKKVPSFFIVAIVFILSLYFMITDSQKVSAAMKKPFSDKFLAKMKRFRMEIKKYVGGYIKAQLTIMCISFTIILIGLSLLGIKYAPIISLAIAIFDALPFFGSGAVLWPWAIVSFIMGNTLNGVGLIIIYLVVILMRQLIEPKLVSKNIGVHPILTLMAMYIGFRIFSIGGMILGPLALVFLVSLYRTGIFDNLLSTANAACHKIGRDMKKLANSLKNDDEEKDDE